MMDTEDYVNQIWDDPPEPYNHGCAREAFAFFLRPLRWTGFYHEYGYYTQLENLHKLRENLDHEVSTQRVLATSEKRRYPARQTAKKNRVHQFESKTAPAFDEKTTSPGGCSNRFLCRYGMINSPLSSGNGTPIQAMTSSQNSPATGKSWLKAIFSDRTYHFIVVVALWANVLRCFKFLQPWEDINWVGFLCPVIWLMLGASSTAIAFVSCIKRNHFYEFFTKWVSIYQDPVTRALGMRGAMTTRFTKAITIIQWVTHVTVLSSVIFILVMPDDFSGGFNNYLNIAGYRSTVTIAVSAVVLNYISACWISPIGFVIVLSHFIATQFLEFQQVMKYHIAEAGPNFPRWFKQLRECYLALCDTVGVMDRFIRVITGIVYSGSILLASFVMYQLVNLRMETSVLCITLIWETYNIVFMGVVTYYLAQVNRTMHSVIEELQVIQTSNISLEQLGQLQMFLSLVNGPSMGFTIFGMVVITRELMLTLFGLFVTYAVILLQFK